MRTLLRFCVGVAPQSKQASRVYLLMASFFGLNLADLLFWHVKMCYNITILLMGSLLFILFTILYNQVNCPVVKHLL